MRVISGNARGTKLKTLAGENTRPTLDRVKESLFSIIQDKIQEAYVLDLFAGSGALGIETLSRGAKYAVFCDNEKQAIEIIQENIEKTKNVEKALIMKCDYTDCLEKVVLQNKKFDIIFIDPPYESSNRKNAIEIILQKNLLSEDGIIIIETQDKTESEKITEFNVYDERKYGRVSLIFLNRKGKN